MNERSERVSNTVSQIGSKYWLVRSGDQVAGVIVWLENGTYIPYVDGLPVCAFANRDAVIEYVGVLESPVGRHAETWKMDAIAQ